MKKNSFLLIIVLLFSVVSCKKETYNEVVLKEDYIFSTLVSKKGEIIFEKYYNGKNKDSLCNVQSLTKGLMSVLIGIAIDKNYIESVDESIEKYFPNEFKKLTDERKKRITIRHLLNQTSGLSWKGHLEHKKWLNSNQPIYFVLKKDLENIPGTRYNYNSGATHLLSVIITKATGKSTLEFANEFLFNSLKINSIKWEKRNKGYYDGAGFGLKMKPIDLMKIGQLLENKGYWNGTMIISEKWVERLFDGKEKSNTKWGLKKSKHGFCWYKSEINGHQVNYGMGYGGQFIILVPSKELIIVTTHNHDTPNGIEHQMKFLNNQLPVLLEKYE